MSFSMTFLIDERLGEDLHLKGARNLQSQVYLRKCSEKREVWAGVRKKALQSILRLRGATALLVTWPAVPHSVSKLRAGEKA